MEVIDLLKQILTRLDGIENRLDNIETDVATLKQDMEKVKKTTNTTLKHVGGYEERIYQLEKVPRLFNPEALDMTDKLAK